MMDLKHIWTPNGKATKQTRLGLLLISVGVIFALWTALPAFLPSPWDVTRALGRLAGEGLAYQLYVSLSTNLQAITISTLISLPLAYLTTLPILRPIIRMITKVRFLGLTGLVIVFALMFGGGHALKVAILVFGMTVFLVTSVFDIVETVPKEEYDYARSLRFGPWRTLFEVVVLGRFDTVLDAVRQNAAMGWVLLTMVEGLVRFEGGLGAMMLAEDKHLHLDRVFALQLVVLIVGVGQDWGISAVRKLLCPYANP
jgi:NitT/TauT family transport system permease protein